MNTQKSVTKNYKLNSKDELTTIIKNNGITIWNELIEFTAKLPYGRNSSRSELELVILEKKGSCSSKHALLKKVADLNKIDNVKLVLGIYRMNKKNTPNIGDVFKENPIDFIPEAHCYLKINNVRTDITTIESNFEMIKSDIIQELEIEPEQVEEFKVNYHKNFIKNWLKTTNSNFDFDKIWEIREKCIANLTQ